MTIQTNNQVPVPNTSAVRAGHGLKSCLTWLALIVLIFVLVFGALRIFATNPLGLSARFANAMNAATNWALAPLDDEQPAAEQEREVTPIEAPKQPAIVPVDEPIETEVCDGSELMFGENLGIQERIPVTTVYPGEGVVLSMDPGTVSIIHNDVLYNTTSDEGMLIAFHNAGDSEVSLAVMTSWNYNNGRHNVHACKDETTESATWTKAWNWQGIPGSVSGELKPVFHFIGINDQGNFTRIVPEWPPREHLNNQEQPTVSPTQQVQPTAAPTQQAQPTAAPTQQAQPTAAPTQQAQPTAAPTTCDPHSLSGVGPVWLSSDSAVINGHQVNGRFTAWVQSGGNYSITGVEAKNVNIVCNPDSGFETNYDGATIRIDVDANGVVSERNVQP